MTVEELIKLLKQLPKETIIYIEADHGQQPEQANFINVTKSKELPYYGEDLNWDEHYDESDSIEGIKNNQDIIAILIS